MDLSIIITTKNRKEKLLKCISSIKKADFFSVDWELIVVDDNSDDGTERLSAQDFNIKKSKIIHNASQQMMVKSRNIGTKEASGKYLMFIDDDNIVSEKMFVILFYFAEKNKSYGIIGPSMYYLENKEKYLDFQKINFFTGRTIGKIDCLEQEVCDSDGIPNVFLIKKTVFESGGYFDEELIQTFTEPDFAFNAKKFGYKCGIVKEAKVYHDVSYNDSRKSRGLGGQFSQKAYCLMRNRTVIISRYGNWLQKIIYLLFFSWFWPLIYSILMLREKRFDLVELYWKGFFDGVRYFFTGKLINSLEK